MTVRSEVEHRGYVSASLQVIADVVGALQLAEQAFVSLDRIHSAFKFIRTGESWVNYYQLKLMIAEMVKRNLLITEQVHRRGRVVVLYSLADWNGWWLNRRSEPDFAAIESIPTPGEFDWIRDPRIRQRAERDPEFAATIRAEGD